MGYIDTTYLPFALGTHGHARGAYTFLHELSHIFGAGHDKKTATEGKEGEYYKYGYGSSFKKGAGPKQGFRTVLAYGYPYYSIRVNYLSSPNIEFQGVKTGSLTADNARVLTENRYRSAGNYTALEIGGGEVTEIGGWGDESA